MIYESIQHLEPRLRNQIYAVAKKLDRNGGSFYRVPIFGIVHPDQARSQTSEMTGLDWPSSVGFRLTAGKIRPEFVEFRSTLDRIISLTEVIDHHEGVDRKRPALLRKALDDLDRAADRLAARCGELDEKSAPESAVGLNELYGSVVAAKNDLDEALGVKEEALGLESADECRESLIWIANHDPSKRSRHIARRALAREASKQ